MCCGIDDLPSPRPICVTDANAASNETGEQDDRDDEPSDER